MAPLRSCYSDLLHLGSDDQQWLRRWDRPQQAVQVQIPSLVPKSRIVNTTRPVLPLSAAEQVTINQPFWPRRLSHPLYLLTVPDSLLNRPCRFLRLRPRGRTHRRDHCLRDHLLRPSQDRNPTTLSAETLTIEHGLLAGNPHGGVRTDRTFLSYPK